MLPLLSLTNCQNFRRFFDISQRRGRRATLDDKVVQQFDILVDIATSLQIGVAILFSIWIKLLNS